jgi:Domain of unknown function (DUF4384)
MTQEEIRKLLGGYSTNALTADERRILFEAALDDQELFNALQNEDALRELLDDPGAREQVRQALERRRPRFWSRRWVLGVAMPAVAAVVAIVVMNRARAPQPIPQVAPAAAPQIEARAVAPKAEPAPPPEVKKQVHAARKIAPKISAPIPAPAPAPTAAAAARLAIPDAIRQEFSTAFVESASPYQGPLVQYSLVRSGPDGDAVQVEVTTEIAGYLALYELDAAGNSKLVYPPNDSAARVFPSVTIQIPNSPIKIADATGRLRLVVVPAAPSVVMGQLNGAAGGTTLGTGNALLQQQSAPLVIDIPLAP